MEREATRAYVNQYGHLRDVQYAVYERYARKHGLTARELFVLDILWFAPVAHLGQGQFIAEVIGGGKEQVRRLLQDELVGDGVAQALRGP